MRFAGLLATVILLLSASMARANHFPASFAYVLQADGLAPSKAAAVARLAASGRDWVVLDAAFDGDTPWERGDLDEIRRGQPGRKIIAYISIGEAEDYRPYWRKEWNVRGNPSAARPSWLGDENPDWKGNSRVKYWQPEWQKIILAAVDEVMRRGFDGVYLDIVDGFETFEWNGSEFIDNRLNPETKQSYRRDMVDWVKAIATRARAINPEALVIPQNGSQLLAFADFTDAISAIGIEDLMTNGDKLQPKSQTIEILENLQKMAAAQKPVLLVEYCQNAERQMAVKNFASQHGLVLLLTDRQLQTIGHSGD